MTPQFLALMALATLFDLAVAAHVLSRIVRYLRA